MVVTSEELEYKSDNTGQSDMDGADCPDPACMSSEILGIVQQYI